ncbi:MAG: TonB-dependent receptor [Novosphingobium sp.]|nr:TonB-dependent receptor [Novosphingobium sp.]
MRAVFAGGASLAVFAAVFGSPAFAADDTTAPANAAAAADASADGLGTIIVTAQRRAEDVQHAALSITAITGDSLKAKGVTDTDAIARTTVGIEIQPSSGPYTTFSIRSVSSLSGNAFADPAVAVNYNGVYLATPTTFRGLYYDLDRIEVLKGPQGTLYGRNATAGAINIIPKKPDFSFGGDASVDVGNYGHFDFSGALNVPLSDTVAFRVAGQRAKHNGYMSDGTSDEDVQAARASLLFEPSSNFSLLLSGDWSHEGGKGPGATLRTNCSNLGKQGNGCFVADPYTDVGDLASYYTAAHIAPQTTDPFLDSNYYGANLNADLTTGIGTFSLIGGYRKSDVSYVTTGTSWQLREKQHPEQESVELRLASPSGQRFQYVFGAYYLNTDLHARANGENATRHTFSDQWTNLSGWTGALFSQLTYGLTDTFRLTGGLRYTYEQKSSDSKRYNIATIGPDPVIPPAPVGNPVNTVVGKQSWNQVNWKAGFELDAGPSNLLYGNVSTGFKAGGFYYGPPGSDTYQPEKVISYVLGSKNRFFGNRVQLNAEAFYLNYTDQQVSFVKLVGSTSTLVTENAGKSHVYGLEVEGDFLPLDNTRIGAQVQYLKAKYDSFTYQTLAPPPAASDCAVTPGVPQATVDCAGVTPLNSPEWTIMGDIEQTIPLGSGAKIVAEGNVRYEDHYQTDISYIPLGLGGGTARVNLGLSYIAPNDRFSIKAYVDNVTDVVTVSAQTMSSSYSVFPYFGSRLLAPRTFGVRASVNF